MNVVRGRVSHFTLFGRGGTLAEIRGDYREITEKLAEELMELPPEMYRNYVERRRADHTRLLRSVRERRPEVVEEFKTLGHQIKGNASSFGFEDLIRIGEEMERLGKAAAATTSLDAVALEKFTRALGELETWIARAEARFESESN